MKKLAVILILGVLLVGFVGLSLVLGDGDGTGECPEQCPQVNQPLCENGTLISQGKNSCNCTLPSTCCGDNICSEAENEDNCEVDCAVINNTNGNQSQNENEENETEDEDEDEGTIVTKTVTIGNKTTFLPWQKRNESECPEGCSCHGAVTSCPTENGRIITIEAGRSGRVIVITIERDEIEAEVCEVECEEECEEGEGEVECEVECEEECEEVEAETELEIEQENEQDEEGKNKTKLKAKLSNGRNAEIKIMPDVASERALERLRLKVCSEENNCTIELKEVPVRNERHLAYEVQVERHFRILALFRTKAQVKAQIDAETGEVIVVKKPWWAFLASEPEE